MNTKDDIIAAKEAIKAAWLGRPGVTGMDVGFKYVGGKRTADVAIRLLVRKKLADVAPGERFPNMLGQHKTDVIEREFKLASPLPDTKYYDPMKGGVQITYATGDDTTGMFVRDNVTGQLMILGTCHGSLAPNSPIYQPSNTTPQPGGALIGYLIRGGHYLTPPVDADLFSFGAPRGAAFEIEELGCVKGVRTVGPADLGMPVRKRGRTTGLTHGTLESLAGSVAPYPPDYQGNVITYDNHLSFAVDSSGPNPYFDPDGVAVFAKPGDSGSVIVDKDNNAIALVCVGTLPDMTVVYGPAVPDILSALNVTPCFCGTILPRQIILTSSEVPTAAPTTSGFGWDPTPTVIGDWGKSVSGVENVRPFPNCPSKPYKWTVTNVYQLLSFRATVLGFNQPSFSWTVNGQKLNDFNTDGSGLVSFMTHVWRDTQIAPHYSHALEEVKLSFSASHGASYDTAGTYCGLGLFPTAVQGHILLTVEVEVQDMDGTVSPPQKIVATLDTQQLTWEAAYYLDQAKCVTRTAEGFGAVIHPWTLLNVLLSQPDPPPEVVNGTRFLTQLGMELGQLAVTQPKAAQELTRIFAQTLNVPQEWLSNKGVGPEYQSR